MRVHRLPTHSISHMMGVEVADETDAVGSTGDRTASAGADGCGGASPTDQVNGDGDQSGERITERGKR
jgi:hypothetical protein